MEFKKMNVLIVDRGIIPAKLYGGTERVIWGLGKELIALGHNVIFLVGRGSFCDFAPIIEIKDAVDITEQIPNYIDLVHFHFTPNNINRLKKPYVITIHGNCNDQRLFNKNSIFVSQNHAQRFNSNSFVHNGLDWDEYTKPSFSQKTYFHFLGKAAWRVKNVQGAIDIIKKTKHEKLKILGGNRFNFNMGLRFTFSPRVDFYGMVGGVEKSKLLDKSKGLIFPVKWHEPFGLAIIESLYYGCPIFGTPYGSLPEIVNQEVGSLSNCLSTLVEAVQNASSYNPKICHDYAIEMFNSKRMATTYLQKYEIVLNGENLNSEMPYLQNIQKTKYLPWIKS